MERERSDVGLNRSTRIDVGSTSQVASGIGELHEVAGELTMKLDGLESRMQSVLLPSNPEPAGIGNNQVVRPVLVPLAEQLNELTVDLRRLVKRVADIQQRLEL